MDRIPFWTAVALAIGCVTLYLRLDTLNERNARLEQARAQAQHASDQRQQVIDRLYQHISTLDAQQQQHAQQQAELTRLASDRSSALKELEHANDTLRQWADTRMPEPIGRLRSHNALTGADAYREHLRRPEAVHTPSPQR